MHYTLWFTILLYYINIIGLLVKGGVSPLSSTWPHLNSDVGLEKGEY